MPAPRPRRRQKIVDAKFQLGLGFHLVGYIYLYVVLFALAANASALSSLFLADIDDPAYSEAVLALRGFAHFIAVPLALTFVVTAFHAVILTHRIAGPVYRAKLVLRDLARRRPPKEVRFRDKDYLHDLAAEMTTTLEALREEQARLRRMNEETAMAARELLVASEAGAEPERLGVLAHAVVDATERLDRHLTPPTTEAALPEVERVPVAAADLPEPVALPEF